MSRIDDDVRATFKTQLASLAVRLTPPGYKQQTAEERVDTASVMTSDLLALAEQNYRSVLWALAYLSEAERVLNPGSVETQLHLQLSRLAAQWILTHRPGTPVPDWVDLGVNATAPTLEELQKAHAEACGDRKVVLPRSAVSIQDLLDEFNYLNPANDRVMAAYKAASELQNWIDARVPLEADNRPRAVVTVSEHYVCLELGGHVLWDSENYSEDLPEFQRCLDRYTNLVAEAAAPLNSMSAAHVREGCPFCADEPGQIDGPLVYSRTIHRHVHVRCIHIKRNLPEPSVTRVSAREIAKELHLDED